MRAKYAKCCRIAFISFKPRLHEQIKPPLIAQIIDPYEVTPDEFAQIKLVLFDHVNEALS